jgi:hypothetical protein
MRWSGDKGLVEGDRQDFMLAVVAHIGDIEQPVIGKLVLKIKGPVLGVRQLVFCFIHLLAYPCRIVTHLPSQRRCKKIGLTAFSGAL